MNALAENYWLTTVQVRPAREFRPLPERVDIAVIGGGFTGLAAARALARAGASVAVLEKHTTGWGASSRNGGMVLTGMKLGIETLTQRYGLEAARRLFQFSLDAIDCVEALVQEEDIDCGFSRCGHVELAYKPAHFTAFERTAGLLQREFSHTVQILDPAALQAEITSVVYRGALLDKVSAGLNPARYVVGLADAAQRSGAYLYENIEVTGVEKVAPGFKLKTKQGSMEAGEVIVATSGYTGPATPALQQRIIPIGSYIIATEPLPADLAASLIPHSRMMFDSKNSLYYFRLTPDKRMLFGGRASFVPETPASVQRSAEMLRQGMLWVFPQLAAVQVQYVWGGTLDFALDWMPHAGEIGAMHYALGYAGHGVALATLLGTRLGEILAGSASSNPFQDLGFPRLPLGMHAAVPPLLPLAGWWFRFLDWIS